jgi:hypothetical protein
MRRITVTDIIEQTVVKEEAEEERRTRRGKGRNLSLMMPMLEQRCRTPNQDSRVIWQ